MPGSYQRISNRHLAVDVRNNRINDALISYRDENPGISRAQMIVQYAVIVISGLLLMRFLLALFGANSVNSLVNTVFGLTSPLLLPFRGLFNYEVTTGVARFEVETLIATIVYILIGLALIRLFDAFRKT
jgi:uncharacterized protein YggT (Ycf19 family)